MGKMVVCSRDLAVLEQTRELVIGVPTKNERPPPPSVEYTAGNMFYDWSAWTGGVYQREEHDICRTAAEAAAVLGGS